MQFLGPESQKRRMEVSSTRHVDIMMKQLKRTTPRESASLVRTPPTERKEL